MKAIYPLRSKQRRPYFKRAIILATVLIVGAFVFSIFDSLIISALAPIWRSEDAITSGLRESVMYFKSKQALIFENRVLREKLNSLELKMASISKDLSQADILLQLKEQYKTEEILSGAVLTHPPQTPYDIIIIDVGSNSSVVVGSKVILPEGPLIGKVIEVFPRESKVELYSSNEVEYDAVLERHNVPVTLIGAGAGNFRITAPRTIEVVRGDRILSPDSGARLIAVVKDINIEPTDSFIEILAISPINIFNLRHVFVIP